MSLQLSPDIDLTLGFETSFETWRRDNNQPVRGTGTYVCQLERDLIGARAAMMLNINPTLLISCCVGSMCIFLDEMVL